MKSKNILGELKERKKDLQELLNCKEKVDNEAVALITEELNKINKKIERMESTQSTKAEKTPIDRRKNLIRDKKKHGMHWIPRAKKFYKKVATRKMRKCMVFKMRGNGYKKSFDLSYTLD